jgi:hypothetical protein
MLGTMAKRAAIKKVLIPLSFFWSIATPSRSPEFPKRVAELPSVI